MRLTALWAAFPTNQITNRTMHYQKSGNNDEIGDVSEYKRRNSKPKWPKLSADNRLRHRTQHHRFESTRIPHGPFNCSAVLRNRLGLASNHPSSSTLANLSKFRTLTNDPSFGLHGTRNKAGKSALNSIVLPVATVGAQHTLFNQLWASLRSTGIIWLYLWSSSNTIRVQRYQLHCTHVHHGHLFKVWYRRSSHQYEKQ